MPGTIPRSSSNNLLIPIIVKDTPKSIDSTLPPIPAIILVTLTNYIRTPARANKDPEGKKPGAQ